MRKIKLNLKNIKLNPGDLLVIYRGTSTMFIMEENTVVIKGNIKRDKLVEKIHHLTVDEY